MFFDILREKAPSVPDGITVEQFPNKTRVKDGKYGQSLKLPMGIHVVTGERSCSSRYFSFTGSSAGCNASDKPHYDEGERESPDG